MTASEAFNHVEKHAENLGFNEPGIVTITRVSSVYPDYEIFNDALIAGLLTPTEYAKNCCELIDEFSRTRIKSKLFKLLMEVENEHSIRKE